ncbi:NAD(P)/FAD-dependent oxidoreductase [Actinoplanes sp. NPDC049802]|uniref:NAD(P)/FAD-dependent oxidoreductase n=1 Tax=Actinoplanes sp. NPDC049802 TaxID=3154742 RepID=UPI0033E9A889
MFDVIVVGGGPAGLSAALTLGRAVRTTLLIDSAEYRNAPAEEMHNFLTRDGTPPSELRAIARAELGRYPTVEIRDAAVDNARAVEGGEGFELSLADGDTVQARRLVLATGLADDLPPIDNIRELWGRGVYHCPYCHGYETRGTPIAVLDADPVMVGLALHLRRFSDDVVLCANGGGDQLDEQTRARLAANGVPVRFEKVVRLESAGGELESVVFDSGAPLPRRSLFAQSRFGQRSKIPAQLGCRLLPDGCVAISDFHETSVPGVYAAGDMAHRESLPMPTPFVIVAAAGGTMAAIAADKNLVATDTAI